MFDVGYSELLVIAIVMIVVVGPKDLPIKSGILPLPNTRSTIAKTITQCQIEKLPILELQILISLD